MWFVFCVLNQGSHFPNFNNFQEKQKKMSLNKNENYF